MSAPRTGRPHARVYLCTKLAGDEDAGRLMSWCVGWSPKATLRLRGRQGVWNANSREQILTATGMKHKKWRRVALIAAEYGIEFVLGKHRGKNKIFTRPKEALLRYLRGELSLCEARRILAEGHFTGHFRGHFSIPSTPLTPSNPGTRKSALPIEGRGRQPTREAAPPPDPAPPPSPHVSASPPARQDSTVTPLIRRAAVRTANAELVARVQAVLDRDLSPTARRAELLAALPERSDVPGIRGPSQMYGDRWQGFTAEVLVRLHVEHLACAGRSAKKQGIRPQAPCASLWLAEGDNPWQDHIEQARQLQWAPFPEDDPYLTPAEGTAPAE